jgi:hypothetical protein
MKKYWLFGLILLAGCASTHITSNWKNQNASPQKVDPVLVIGIMNNNNDTTLCRTMEERFVEELKNLGYHAVASSVEYGPNVFDPLNEEEPLKILYRTRYGAVITIELLNKETIVFPPPLWLDKENYWNNRPFVTDASNITNNAPNITNYYAVQTRYIWASRYYDLGGIVCLYSIKAISYDPKSDKSLAKDYSKIVIADMVKSGIIKKQVIPLKAF